MMAALSLSSHAVAMTSYAAPVAPLAAHVQPSACRWRPPHASMSEDAAPVLAAALLAGAAGYLQYSVSAGEKGLNAFLMKEKSENPFYQDNFKTAKPSTPAWFTLQLPTLDFVEVYGQADAGPPAGSQRMSSELKNLYQDLDEAIEREDYEAAAQIKARIDAESERV